MNTRPRLNIKALRSRRHLTQCQLATMIGVNQSKISEYERGEKSPKLFRLPVIAAALGVGIHELFTGDEAAESSLPPSVN